MTEVPKRYLEHSPKKVWLVCMGPSCYDIFEPLLTQEATPDLYDEIWAINMASNVFWHDLVFWMDDLDAQDQAKPGLISMLRRKGTPVITSKAYPDILPNSYDYPLSECSVPSMALIGKPYMTNSVAQAIAYAMHIGVHTLRLYGADFTYPNRDFAESGRACVEFWIALAHQKQMKIELTPRTSLFDAIQDKGIYGYREQQDITLPNGDVFRYTPVAEAVQQGDPSGQAYTPKPPETDNEPVSGRLSGIDGELAAHSRDGSADANDAEPAESPAVDGSGQGLRDRVAAERDERPALAGADLRGAGGGVQETSQESLSPGEGGPGPGQSRDAVESARPGPYRGNGPVPASE